MSNFFTSSIGKKFIVSLTGLFLVLFLIVHLTVNSMIVFDDTGVLFNRAAHFMEVNLVISIIEPLLAIGTILHFVLATTLTLQNQFKRDVNYSGLARYKKRDAATGSTWTSRNMFILGAVILTFLVIHIANFFWKMQFGGETESPYELVTGLFINCTWYVVIYIIGAVALGLHLHHGIWSGFQTLGWSNRKWRKILNIIGIVISVIFAGGYAFIPLYVVLTH